MPGVRTAAGALFFQLFPGEGMLPHPGINVGHSPLRPIGDYYSHPEMHGFPLQPSPWGFTEERRATLALYDYRRTDAGL